MAFGGEVGRAAWRTRHLVRGSSTVLARACSLPRPPGPPVPPSLGGVYCSTYEFRSIISWDRNVGTSPSLRAGNHWRPFTVKSTAKEGDGTAAQQAGDAGVKKPPAPPAWTLAWLRFKLHHIVEFFKSYWNGAKQFAREIRVASRLAYRLYAEGHDLSRAERKAIRRSARDLVRVLPIASMFMIFGLELSTVAILRFVPNLLPKAFRSSVIPAAGELGIVDKKQAEKDREAQVRLRHEQLIQISELTRQMAASMASEKAGPEDIERITTFFETIEDPVQRLGTKDILEIAPLFRKHITMEKLPRPQLLHLAALHPGILPTAVDRVTPSFLIARALRIHVQHLRSDDKEIYWEGLDTLDDEALEAACQERALVRGSKQAVATTLRVRLRRWLTLSLNREVPSSLLLLSTALMMRDEATLREHTLSPQSIKLGMLREERERLGEEMAYLRDRIADVDRDIAHYAEVVCKEADRTDAVRPASMPSSPPSHVDIEADLLLRGREAAALKQVFGRAVAAAGSLPVGGHDGAPDELPSSFARNDPVVPVELAAIYLQEALVSGHVHNVVPLDATPDHEPLQQECVRRAPSRDLTCMEQHVHTTALMALHRSDTGSNGIDFIEFCYAYQDARQQLESLNARDQREAAIELLEQALEQRGNTDEQQGSAEGTK